MPKLTVVFEYPDGLSLDEAKKMFTKSNISNLAGVVEYDAIEAYKNASKVKVDEEETTAQ